MDFTEEQQKQIAIANLQTCRFSLTPNDKRDTNGEVARNNSGTVAYPGGTLSVHFSIPEDMSIYAYVQAFKILIGEEDFKNKKDNYRHKHEGWNWIYPPGFEQNARETTLMDTGILIYDQSIDDKKTC
jgi:hypothetical protein